MSVPYSSVCEDFYVNMRLGSQLNLPHNRETVLHFFERIQKSFPQMSRLRKADNGEISIEEDRSGNAYRWLTMESRRLASGFVNPPTLDDALKLHNLVLDTAPCHLGISPIEIDYMDLLFGFDLTYSGNHDEIVAESLLAGSPLACLMEEENAKAVDIQPSITIALTDDCRLQARIDLVTRTNSYQVRTGDYGDDIISVYLIIRRYWGDRPKDPMDMLLGQMADRADALCASHIVPKILRPLSAAIASRS